MGYWLIGIGWILRFLRDGPRRVNGVCCRGFEGVFCENGEDWQVGEKMGGRPMRQECVFGV